MPLHNDQNHKVAIVTGGSRGIGRSIVVQLAQQGVSSLFTYRANKDEAEKVVAAAQSVGATAIALRCDQADLQQVNTFVSEVPQALKQLDQEKFDYLINNAGTALQAPFDTTTPEQVDQLFSVQFKGLFFITQGLLPLMNDGGRIVNVSSAVTRITLPGISVYASMKAAVETLTKYMAKELGSRRIAVNAVSPGAVESDFGGGTVRDNADLNQMIAKMTLLGRVGLPDDIGAMIASLVAPANAWINGQTIEVSGGQSL